MRNFQRSFYRTSEIPYLLFHAQGDEVLLDLIVKARAEASTCHRYKRQMVNTLISQIFITMLENHEYDIEVPEFNLAGKKTDLIQILDYINTNYPEKVFCVSTSEGEQKPVSGSFTKLTTLQADHRTLIHIRIATPGGLLNVDVYVNSGTSSADSNKQTNYIVLKDNGNAIYNIPNIAAGETKTYTITSNGSGSYSVVGSDFFTASVSGNTLTITGVKAGSANLILTQAADDTYKAATGTYWLTATGSQEQTGGSVTLSEDAVLLSKTKSSNYNIFVSDQKGDGTYDIYFNEQKVKTGVTSIKLTWTENQASWGSIGQISIKSNAGSYNYTSEEAISGSYTINDLNLFTQNDGQRKLQIQSSGGVPCYLYIE